MNQFTIHGQTSLLTYDKFPLLLFFLKGLGPSERTINPEYREIERKPTPVQVRVLCIHDQLVKHEEKKTKTKMWNVHLAKKGRGGHLFELSTEPSHHKDH